MQPNPLRPPSGFTFFKFFMSAFGLIFGGIGLTVLAFLWIIPAEQNSPFANVPIPFRLFASLIALAFVAFSALWVTVIWKVMPNIDPARHLSKLPNILNPTFPNTIHKHSIPTACPRCGAKILLNNNSENAPKTCAFCGSNLT
ncbi:MAG: hypothetical protein RL215_3119 [Planctomycetota bacterium]|jgi:hypothetical protein